MDMGDVLLVGATPRDSDADVVARGLYWLLGCGWRSPLLDVVTVVPGELCCPSANFWRSCRYLSFCKRDSAKRGKRGDIWGIMDQLFCHHDLAVALCEVARN